MTNRESIVKLYIYGIENSENDLTAPISLQDFMLEMVPTDFHEKCTACPIHEECRAPVPGVGNVNASVVFIGRNPGKTEDSIGMPFVGKGGELLDLFIKWIGLDRNDLYITNLVKCHTEDDRIPAKSEIQTCTNSWLKPELMFLKPKLILTFGAEACETFTGSTLKLMRNTTTVYDSRAENLEGVSLIPCIHPGAALRSGAMYNEFKKDSRYVKVQLMKLGIIENELQENYSVGL